MINYFFHDTLRKYQIAFGNLFKDIHVQRFDSDGNSTKDIRVPLTAAGKRKFFTHLQQSNVQHERPHAITLPRIAFAMTDLVHDPERQLNKLNKWKHYNLSDDQVRFIGNPVPYNLSYDVTIWTKNIADSNQIVEQILPYFQPSLDITVNELPEFGIKRDVPIVLESVSNELEDDLSEATDSIRINIWTLSFIVKAYLYPPVKDIELIKRVMVNYFDYDGNVDDPYSYKLMTKDTSVIPWDISLDDYDEDENVLETTDFYNY